MSTRVCRCRAYSQPHAQGAAWNCIYRVSPSFLNSNCICAYAYVNTHRPGKDPHCFYSEPDPNEQRVKSAIESLESDTVAEYIEPPASAWGNQVGGDHYRDLPIQPSQYIVRNGLGWFAGNVIKYVTRYEKKGGLQDLKKARHYLELLIEEQEKSGE